MKLTPLPTLLKYAFRQEGLSTPEHKNLIKRLTAFVDKPYCHTLIERGIIGDCDPAPHNKQKPKSHRMAGHPVQAEKGKNAHCKPHGIMT